jgi:hypothetical protein
MSELNRLTQAHAHKQAGSDKQGNTGDGNDTENNLTCNFERGFFMTIVEGSYIIYVSVFM